MGVIRTRNKNTDEYCVAQWKSEPYTLQENTCMRDYESPIKAYTCEIVCDVTRENACAIKRVIVND